MKTVNDSKTHQLLIELKDKTGLSMSLCSYSDIKYDQYYAALAIDVVLPDDVRNKLMYDISNIADGYSCDVQLARHACDKRVHLSIRRFKHLAELVEQDGIRYDDIVIPDGSTVYTHADWLKYHYGE